MGRANNGINDRVALAEHRRGSVGKGAAGSADARRERREQAREQLKQAVLELKTSDGWRRWLRVRSKFRRYSPNNQFLIACQMPDATQIAGYTTWKRLGRQVRRGEKGIRILAPVVGKKVVDEESGEEQAVIRTFRLVSVFDVSQTDGEPLPPSPIQPLTGDTHAMYLPKLAAFAREIGFTYAEKPLSGVDGYCDYKNKVIAVDETQAPNAKVVTAVHEIAHALGVDYKTYTRRQAEVMVESAAFIVCDALGLDTSRNSVGYVGVFDDSGDLKALTDFAATVDSIAERIENAIGFEAALGVVEVSQGGDDAAPSTERHTDVQLAGAKV